MADRSPAPDTPELRERWGGFEFSEAWTVKADAAIARAVRWLLDVQGADGSFPASSRLRVPAPSALDPLADPATTITYLDHARVFTTATVLSALHLSLIHISEPTD